MIADVLIELGVTVMVLSALLITCAVLVSVRPPKKPPHGERPRAPARR